MSRHRIWQLVRSALIILLASLAILALLDYVFISRMLNALSPSDVELLDPPSEAHPSQNASTPHPSLFPEARGQNP